MNLLKKCTNSEIKLLKEAGINIEDRDYTKEEFERSKWKIMDYIMSQSTKDIEKLNRQYVRILNKINM